MYEELFETLENLGVDTKESIARFVGNEALYVKFLKRFPDDKNLEEMKRNITDKDYEALLKSSHALKGLTGNLGLKFLYEKLSKMVEDLRAEEYREIESLYAEIEENYKKLCEVLK